MTNEERDIISRFIERVGGAQGASFGSVPGAVPSVGFLRAGGAAVLFARPRRRDQEKYKGLRVLR